MQANLPNPNHPSSPPSPNPKQPPNSHQSYFINLTQIPKLANPLRNQKQLHQNLEISQEINNKNVHIKENDNILEHQPQIGSNDNRQGRYKKNDKIFCCWRNVKFVIPSLEEYYSKQYQLKSTINNTIRKNSINRLLSLDGLKTSDFITNTQQNNQSNTNNNPVVNEIRNSIKETVKQKNKEKQPVNRFIGKERYIYGIVMVGVALGLGLVRIWID